MGAVEAHIAADIGIGQRHRLERRLAVQQQIAADLDAVHVERPVHHRPGHQQIARDAGARQIDLVELAQLQEQIAADLDILQPGPALDLALAQGQIARHGGAQQIDPRQVAGLDAEIMGDVQPLEIETAADGDGVEIGAAGDSGAHQAEIGDLGPIIEFQIGAEFGPIQIEQAGEARTGEGNLVGIAQAVEIHIAQEVGALQRQFETGCGIAQRQRVGEMGAGDMHAVMGHLRAQIAIEQHGVHELGRDVVGEGRARQAGGEIRRLAGTDLAPGPVFRVPSNRAWPPPDRRPRPRPATVIRRAVAAISRAKRPRRGR